MLEARVKQASVLKKLLDGTPILTMSISPRSIPPDLHTSGPIKADRLPKQISPADGSFFLAIKELVTDGNLDCTDEGIVSAIPCCLVAFTFLLASMCTSNPPSPLGTEIRLLLAVFHESADILQALQAMDNSHVALVSLKLIAEQFESYRCDRNMPLGVNVSLSPFRLSIVNMDPDCVWPVIKLTSLTKILKCAKDNDVVTLKAADDADSLGMVFESPSEQPYLSSICYKRIGKAFAECCHDLIEEDRVGEYEMKLMDIDQEHLGIPDTQYDATITMSSSEFQRICRDLAALGESVKIEASKEGVRFSSEGEVGTGSVLLKQSAGTDRAGVRVKKEVKRDPDQDEEEEEEEEEKPNVENEGGEQIQLKDNDVLWELDRGRDGRGRAAEEAQGAKWQGQGEFVIVVRSSRLQILQRLPDVPQFL